MSTNFLIAEISVHTVQPLSFTHHSIDGLPMLTRGVDAEGKPLKTVFIPAAQLRGRIRHEAALAVMRGKSEKVKLEDAYMLALGQDLRPQDDEQPEAIRLGEQVKQRLANPFLDLFGTWKLASRLYVSHLMPEANVGPDRISHIRRDLDVNEDIMEALGDEEQDRLYERQGNQSLASKVGGMIDVTKRELKAAKKAKDTNKTEELEAKLEELETLKKSHKGEDKSENTKHLVELQAIPAGITLHGKITVQNPLASDVAALLNAFEGISKKPYMGAQRARGCGEVSGTVKMRHTDGEVYATLKFGGFAPAEVQITPAGQALLTPLPETA